ncbi:MAG: tetratricopeptide repeat protein [Pseudonocardiaceae bacterium]
MASSAFDPLRVPEGLTSVLRDSAGEAMEFTRSTAVSSIGAGTLDHLQAVVTELDWSHCVQPPGELFAVARAYRGVDQLIQGRHTLREERELYVYAAWLSELLAWLAHDFGAPGCLPLDRFAPPPRCLGGGGVRPGSSSFDGGLEEFPELRDISSGAGTGRSKRTPDDHTVTDTPTPTSVISSTSNPHVRARAECIPYIWLADYKQAETHARTALAVQESASPANRSPIRGAIARIDLSIALAYLGSLDEAVAQGSQALSSLRVVDSVLSRAGELDTAPMTCFPQKAIAQGFHEQYRQTIRQASGQ